MIYGIDYETRTMSGRPAEPAKPEPLRCGSCGAETLALEPAVWDPTLLVGACCEVSIDHRCPDCNSDDLAWHEYDFGQDPETGYHDAGEYVVCRACGGKNDARDTEVRIGPAPGDHTDADAPPCPVLIANGLHSLDDEDRDAAIDMLPAHLEDKARACCDQHGLALGLRKPATFETKVAEALRPTGTDDEEEVF